MYELTLAEFLLKEAGCLAYTPASRNWEYVMKKEGDSSHKTMPKKECFISLHIYYTFH